MSRLRDLTGLKFGKLTVLKQGVYKSVGRNRVTWNCICECGTSHSVSSSNLTGGNVKSCGCGFKFKKGEASFNRLLGQYRNNAKKRGYIFELTKDQFRYLTKKNCHYCNSKPKNFQKPTLGNNGGYLYSGIDRVDNSKGYLLSNCVPCCSTCNVSKNSMSIGEFEEWLSNIGSNFKYIDTLSFFDKVKYLME